MSFQVLKYQEGKATLLCEYEIPHGHLFWNSKVFLKLESERADNANLAIVYKRFVQYWDTTQSKITEVRNFNTDYEPGTFFDITGDGIDDVEIFIYDKEND